MLECRCSLCFDTMAGQIPSTGPVQCPFGGNSAIRLQTLKKPWKSLPVLAVSAMGLLFFQRWLCRMQKGDRHLPALCKEAIPAYSAGQGWRSIGSNITAHIFLMISSQNTCEWTLAMNPPSSPLIMAKPPKAFPLCCVSKSGAYSHQDRLHFRFCRRMGPQRDGSIFKGCS